MNARFSDAAVDHYTYVICGDGCLMEGISQEAISLAGHLKLSKMIVLWDDNGISIDGATSLATSEDQLARFEAAGWDAVRVDGHDPEAIAAAIAAARGERPPVADRLPHGDRQGRAQQGGQPQGPRRAARRGRDRRGARGPRLALCAVRSAGGRARRLASDRHQGGRPARRLGSADELPLRREAHGVPAPLRRADAGRLVLRAQRPQAGALRGQAQGRHPQGEPGRDRRARQGDPRAGRRLGRPHRLQPHPGRGASRRSRPATMRAPTSTSASASTAWPPR